MKQDSLLHNGMGALLSNGGAAVFEVEEISQNMHTSSFSTVHEAADGNQGEILPIS